MGEHFSLTEQVLKEREEAERIEKRQEEQIKITERFGEVTSATDEQELKTLSQFSEVLHSRLIDDKDSARMVDAKLYTEDVDVSLKASTALLTRRGGKSKEDIENIRLLLKLIDGKYGQDLKKK